jgi:hypothetical protein
MFFKAVAQYRPDLVILSGVHLLEGQVAVEYFKLNLPLFISQDKYDWKSCE